MLGEPSRSDYDIHFRLFGLSVRIHPLFWLIGIFLGAGSSIPHMPTWLTMLAGWLAALFVSILVHELGHALPLSHYYGARTWIVLYGFGGLACHEPYYRKRIPGTWGTIAYTAAGPLAGFALGVIVIGVLVLCRIEVTIQWLSLGHGISLPDFHIDLASFTQQVLFLPNYVGLLFYVFLQDVLYISVFWGVMNLLPLYPLDGGQIAREIFLVWDRRNGIVHSLWLSVVTGGVIAVLGFMQWVKVDQMQGIPYIPILFGYLAFQSYQMLAYRW